MSDTETLSRVEDWAEDVEEIQAVLLIGSRADPNATMDALSDHDLILFVDDGTALAADDGWLGGGDQAPDMRTGTGREDLPPSGYGGSDPLFCICEKPFRLGEQDISLGSAQLQRSRQGRAELQASSASEDANAEPAGGSPAAHHNEL